MIERMRRLQPVLLWVSAAGMGLGFTAIGPVRWAGVVGYAAAVAMSVFEPYRMATLWMFVGCFTPTYLSVAVPMVGVTVPPQWPVGIGLLACGLSVLPRSTAEKRLTAIAVMLALVWLWIGAMGWTGSAATRLLVGLNSSMVVVLALVAYGMILRTEEGKRTVLSTMSWTGVVVGLGAIVEGVLHWNPFLAAGIQAGTAEKWTTVPIRSGFVRVSWAFSHPIMLGLFLGLAAVCLIEHSGRQAWPARRVAVALLPILVGQMLTLSRGPILFTWLACGLLLLQQKRKARMGGAVWGAAAAVALVGLLLGSEVRSGLTDLLGSGGGEASQSIAIRMRLLQDFFGRVDQLGVFGTVLTERSNVLWEWASLDNEFINLLVTRGFAGLLWFLLLGMGAVGLRVTGVRKAGAPALAFVSSATLLVIGTASTVAFFGAVQPYVIAVMLLTWQLALEAAHDDSLVGAGQ